MHLRDVRVRCLRKDSIGGLSVAGQYWWTKCGRVVVLVG